MSIECAAFAQDPVGYILCAAYAELDKHRGNTAECVEMLKQLRAKLDTFQDHKEVQRVDAFLAAKVAAAASSASSSSSSLYSC